MNQLASFHDYRAILQQEFDRRKVKNPSYSLRAFAKALEVAPSKLSEVLNRKHGLSVASAEGMASKLGFSREGQRYFCDLVALEQFKSGRDLDAVRKRVEKFRVRSETKEFGEDLFKYIADWYNSAILEMFQIHKGKLNTNLFAKKLGITPVEVDEVVSRLVKLKLIEKNNDKYLPTHQRLAFDTQLPSTAIRKFHNDIWQKASRAMDVVPEKDRSTSSLVFAVKKEKLPLLREFIFKFRQEFLDLCDEDADKDSLYSLSIRLFPLED